MGTFSITVNRPQISRHHRHPLHPATVHFPIAFLTAGYFLDAVYGLTTYPATAGILSKVYDFKPVLGEVSRLSYLANIVGLITAAPAVVTGGAELLGMIQRQGLADKLRKSQDKVATVKGMHPKLKIGFAHAILNDIAIFAAGYNWWTRRNAPMYVPDNVNVLLSAGCLPLLLLSAYLGGSLIYEYGVGVQRQGSAKRIKEEGKHQ